jgi:hypothetical protein
MHIATAESSSTSPESKRRSALRGRSFSFPRRSRTFFPGRSTFPRALSRQILVREQDCAASVMVWHAWTIG